MVAATASTAARREALPVAAALSPAGALSAGLPPDDEPLVESSESSEPLVPPVVVAAAAVEVNVVDASSSDSDAVFAPTAVVPDRMTLPNELAVTLAAAVPVDVGTGAVVDAVSSTLVGRPTLAMVVVEPSPLDPAVGLALAVDVTVELGESPSSSPEPVEPVSNPALDSASWMAFSGTSQLALMGSIRSPNVVLFEHHWFMHTTTSDRKLPLDFSHMQSVSVGGQPLCRTQLVMHVGNCTPWTCWTRDPLTSAAYRMTEYCCFANILNANDVSSEKKECYFLILECQIFSKNEWRFKNEWSRREI